MSRAAVVVNTTKLDDDEAFRKSVSRVMDDHGWNEPNDLCQVKISAAGERLSALPHL
jgi:hypothetical protein